MGKSTIDFLLKFDIIPLLCYSLDVERVRTLRVSMVSPDSHRLVYMRDLLRELYAVEELDLCVDAVRELRCAGPELAVLPKLRSVCIVRAGPTASSVAEMTEEELVRSFRGTVMRSTDHTAIISCGYIHGI
jgi:hypothetical protein